MKRILVGALVASAAMLAWVNSEGLVKATFPDPRLIGESEDGLTFAIRSADSDWSRTIAMANDHCAKFGRKPLLHGPRATGRTDYCFECVDP